jgi:hypothetical protein
MPPGSNFNKLIDVITNGELPTAQQAYNRVVEITNTVNRSFVIEYTSDVHIDSRIDMETAIINIHPLICKNKDYLKLIEKL